MSSNSPVIDELFRIITGDIEYLSRLFHVIIEIRIHTANPDIFI